MLPVIENELFGEVPQRWDEIYFRIHTMSHSSCEGPPTALTSLL